MKLKIFIAPLALVVAVVLFINIVRPEYDKMKLNKEQEKRDQATLNEAKMKNQNISSLKADLEENREGRSFMMAFLPDKEKEERIIDLVNYLSKNSDVALLNINIAKIEGKAPPSPVAQAPSDLNFKSPTLENEDFDPSAIPEMTAPAVVSKVDYLTADISVIGKYEKIKMFLENVYRSEMFSKADQISISSQAADESGKSDPENLTADIALNFGYMDSVSVAQGATHSVFGKSKFNWEIVSKIKEVMSRTVPALEDGKNKGINPFLP